MSTSRRHFSNAQLGLSAATIACYGLGYPLALVVQSPAGWVLVTLGGVFLIALGVITIRRMR